MGRGGDAIGRGAQTLDTRYTHLGQKCSVGVDVRSAASCVTGKSWMMVAINHGC